MIIRQRDCPLQPWRNGLGRTREIAVQTSPAAAGFRWRVSVAEVDGAAPFSIFPGIDRSIVLLEGAGFNMTLDGMRQHALTSAFSPFAFAGEARVEVTLVGGPTRDFNLMTRRSEVCGALRVWREPGTRVMPAAAVLVYCACGSVATPNGQLQAGDAWRPRTLAGATVVLGADAVALAALVEPCIG
ncbi:MAG: HutD family protein [Rhodanobacter sp.]